MTLNEHIDYTKLDSYKWISEVINRITVDYEVDEVEFYSELFSSLSNDLRISLLKQYLEDNPYIYSLDLFDGNALNLCDTEYMVDDIKNIIGFDKSEYLYSSPSPVTVRNISLYYENNSCDFEVVFITEDNKNYIKIVGDGVPTDMENKKIPCDNITDLINVMKPCIDNCRSKDAKLRERQKEEEEKEKRDAKYIEKKNSYKASDTNFNLDDSDDLFGEGINNTMDEISRENMNEEYAFKIPTDKAMDYLYEFKRILEGGCEELLQELAIKIGNEKLADYLSSIAVDHELDDLFMDNPIDTDIVADDEFTGAEL